MIVFVMTSLTASLEEMFSCYISSWENDWDAICNHSFRLQRVNIRYLLAKWKDGYAREIEELKSETK